MTPGGLASWQALEFIRGLEGLNLVGLDFVEVSPPYDQSEITAIAAATVAHDWQCLLAGAAGARPRPVGRLYSERMMKIGILQTGHSPEKMRDVHGG